MQPGLMDPVQEREREKGPPVAEQKKHKRTRSGCYTCRTRRVKVRRLRPEALPSCHQSLTKIPFPFLNSAMKRDPYARVSRPRKSSFNK